MRTRAVPTRSPSRAARALALALALALIAPGCASGGEREVRASASLQAAQSGTRSGGQGLYDMPEMRSARLQREVGEDHLERAYAARDARQRESRFLFAEKAFRLAQDDYHLALAKAPRRFHELIENEIAQVAHYMQQIYRDRAPPKVE
jgi:hypothetical protein